MAWLFLNSNIFYISKPLCGASAVHDNTTDHLFLRSAWKETYRAQQSTYSHSMVFTELFVTEATKALQGPKRLSLCSALGLPPSPNHQFAHFGEKLNWHKEALRVAAESSSHQGIRRSEKKMLISIWEQQECPGITKDCVKFSLEEPLSWGETSDLF